MKYKFAVRFLVLIVAIIIATISWFKIVQASPNIEHIKIGKKDYVMGAAGDSSVGTRNVKAKDNVQSQGQSKQASGNSNQKSGVAPKSENPIKSFFKGVSADEPKTLTLAYTCVTEKLVVDKIIPAFQKYWFDKTGMEVNFATGYSLPDFDTMATSISGEPVQIVIMSSSTNAETRGYSRTKWQDTANKGTVFSLPQVFLVRKGNPLRLKSFADLAIPGVRVMHLSPIVGTGGGVWPVWAFYGSALKETEMNYGEKSYWAADEQFQKIQENAFYELSDFPAIKKAFLKGLADVVVCSENSALGTIKANDSVGIVIPPYTIVNDFAVYKMNKHLRSDDEEVANGFIDFLFTSEVQEYAAKSGYRPSDPAVLSKHPEFKVLDNPFNLNYLGEQTAVKKKILLEKWLTNNNNRR